MGSTISWIHDDYEDYEYLCELFGIDKIDMRGGVRGKSFYDHAYEIVSDRWRFLSNEQKNHPIISRFSAGNET